MTTDNQLQK